MEAESASEFMAELRSLAKTCNFGEYLESAIRDNYVCGLRDTKCQQKLLCQTDLTAGRALQRARASEAVHKETDSMQVVRREAEKLDMDGDTNVVYSKQLVIDVASKVILPQIVNLKLLNAMHAKRQDIWLEFVYHGANMIISIGQEESKQEQR